MEFRKMVTITLYARQQKRHRCIEQSFGLCRRGRWWDDLGEWDDLGDKISQAILSTIYRNTNYKRAVNKS